MTDHAQEAIDMNAFNAMFSKIANTITQASELAATVEELKASVAEYSAQVSTLSDEVKAAREINRWMDEQITELRGQRNELQSKASTLSGAYAEAQRERDAFTLKYNDECILHNAVKEERDTAQLRVMELEDEVKALKISLHKMEEENTNILASNQDLDAELRTANATLTNITSLVLGMSTVAEGPKTIPITSTGIGTPEQAPVEPEPNPVSVEYLKQSDAYAYMWVHYEGSSFAEAGNYSLYEDPTDRFYILSHGGRYYPSRNGDYLQGITKAD